MNFVDVLFARSMSGDGGGGASYVLDIVDAIDQGTYDDMPAIYLKDDVYDALERYLDGMAQQWVFWSLMSLVDNGQEMILPVYYDGNLVMLMNNPTQYIVIVPNRLNN